MAAIIVRMEDGRQARLSEPDEDGDYGWVCEACGADQSDRGYQPVADALQEAEGHLEDYCGQG